MDAGSADGRWEEADEERTPGMYEEGIGVFESPRGKAPLRDEPTEDPNGALVEEPSKAPTEEPRDEPNCPPNEEPMEEPSEDPMGGYPEGGMPT